MTRFVLGLALASMATLCQAQAPARFSFAIVGDAPYNRLEETMFAKMLEQIDQEDLAFVLHIGDFKNGSSPCSDSLYAQRLQQFQSVRHPFVFVPGDNDWTDCHRKSAGGYDTLERLDKLRRMDTAFPALYVFWSCQNSSWAESGRR